LFPHGLPHSVVFLEGVIVTQFLPNKLVDAVTVFLFSGVDNVHLSQHGQSFFPLSLSQQKLGTLWQIVQTQSAEQTRQGVNDQEHSPRSEDYIEERKIDFPVVGKDQPGQSWKVHVSERYKRRHPGYHFGAVVIVVELPSVRVDHGGSPTDATTPINVCPNVGRINSQETVDETEHDEEP
jgi:hypothetical protein